MDSDIIHIAAQMKIMEGEMKKMGDDVAQILWTLRGNELDRNDNGFLGQVGELEKRVKALEKFRDRAIYLVIGASLTTGFGIGKVIEMLLAK